MEYFPYNLKTGDVVINSNRIIKVERTTKAQIILENKERFWKKDCSLVGGRSNRWFRRDEYIREASPENVNKLRKLLEERDKKRIDEALKAFKLSQNQLNSIYSIIL